MSETTDLAVTFELSVDQVIARVNKVHEIMKRAMVKDHHYGVIPGTPKPTLLKPGMELLCMTFRLDPQYTAIPTRDPDGYYTVVSTCTLYHAPTGQRLGSGMGQCSTRESRYAYRKAARACPKCGKETIIKGKAEFGGGWLCFTKKDGCGAKFTDTDAAITSQQVGRMDNEDVADQENVVLKMSNKRALGAAVLNVTAASDIFTVDLEDMAPPEHEVKTPPPAPPVTPPVATAPTPDGQPVRLITPPQLKRLHTFKDRAKISDESLHAYLTSLGIESAQDIPMARYDSVIHWIESGGK